ncbi:MAG: hypothetical protein ACFFCO_06860 [Promethearchaeota archaeon]
MGEKTTQWVILAIGIILLIIGPLVFLFTFPLVLHNVIFPITYLPTLLSSLGIILTVFGVFLIIAAAWELYRRRG